VVERLHVHWALPRDFFLWHSASLSQPAIQVTKAMRALTPHGLNPDCRPAKVDAVSAETMRGCYGGSPCQKTILVMDATSEAACRRSDALGKRRRLMDGWAAYCMSERR
jgi:hypothetical protein